MMATRKRHILVVDDEVNICNALRRSLTREGYHITSFTNPNEALDKMEDMAIDAVIADYFMPQMTGLVFLRRMRERFPNVLRIILTGQTDISVIRAAMQQGEIYRFFTKPWDDDELKRCLTVGLEERDKELEQKKRTL